MVKLGDPQVWLDAANQVFFSYGLAFGSIISFGSYNTPDKNCVKDVFILSACNAFTAVYACAVIFSILGFKAQHRLEASEEERLHNSFCVSNSVLFIACPKLRKPSY